MVTDRNLIKLFRFLSSEEKNKYSGTRTILITILYVTIFPV